MLTVSEARATLPALLDRVEAGEEVTITRHGKPVAVLLAPQAARRRTSKAFEIAAWVHAEMEAARKRPFSEFKGVEGPPEWAEEFVAQVRADRDDDPWSRYERL